MLLMCWYLSGEVGVDYFISVKMIEVFWFDQSLLNQTV